MLLLADYSVDQPACIVYTGCRGLSACAQMNLAALPSLNGDAASAAINGDVFANEDGSKGSPPTAGVESSSFSVAASSARPLMSFKGCPRPLGCTILLKVRVTLGVIL